MYGVINMVLVKGLKETAITNPSGISYAIPASYIRELLRTKSAISEIFAIVQPFRKNLMLK